MSQPDAVAALVALNGRQLTGKTRLQKSVYLLKSCGVDLGFEFDYHHYGPYSEELSIASSDAVALGLLNVDWRNTHGNEFAVFSSTTQMPSFDLSAETHTALQILARYDAVTLELAATADFLQHNGYAQSAWDETARRKASKITPHRVDAARRLLAELSGI